MSDGQGEPESLEVAWGESVTSRQAIPVLPASPAPAPEAPPPVSARPPRAKLRPAAVPSPAILAIYDAYPRHVARPAALKAIQKAIGRGHPAELLLGCAQRYAVARNGEPEQYTPHPATWFNQDRFLDDPATWANHAPQGPAVVSDSPRTFTEGGKW